MHNNELDLKNINVKIFILTEKGQWEEGGCGYLSFVSEYSEDLSHIDYISITEDESIKTESITIDSTRLKKLVKHDKTNENLLLFLQIDKECVFEQQNDTIISWIDKKINEEIALSFLDANIVHEIWTKISKIASIKKQDIDIEEEEMRKLVPMTEENLDYILERNRDWTLDVLTLNSEQFYMDFKRLFILFEESENYENIYKLNTLAKILIYGYNPELLEIALNNEYYEILFGVFEYEKGKMKADYREFLTKKTNYKKVYDFQDQKIIDKIHFNYRLNYLNDCILEPIIDETRLNPLAKIIYFTSCEILDYIIGENIILDKFCRNFIETWQNSLEFLRELLNLVRINPNLDIRNILMEKLNAFGLIEILTDTLTLIKESSIKTEQKSKYYIILFDDLTFLNQINTKPFVDLMYDDKNKEKTLIFFKNLTEMLVNEDEGVQCQISEFIKQLLEPNQTNTTKQELLTYLYDVLLIDLFNKYMENKNNGIFTTYFVDILSFCLKKHGSRIRHFLINNNILLNIYSTLMIYNKIALLAQIRLLKNIFVFNDLFIIFYMEGKQLFVPIIDLALKFKNSNNLISSCLREIINYLYHKHLNLTRKYIKDKFPELIPQLNNKLILEKQRKKDKKSKQTKKKDQNNNDNNDDFNQIHLNNGKSTKSLQELLDYEDDNFTEELDSMEILSEEVLDIDPNLKRKSEENTEISNFDGLKPQKKIKLN